MYLLGYVWVKHNCVLLDTLSRTCSEGTIARPLKVPVIDARPSKAHISFRLDAETIQDLKSVARGKGMGYQTLMRSWIMERLEEEKKKAG